MDKDKDKDTAFQAILNDKERIIHALAAKMLGTRYTPHRTNAFKRVGAPVGGPKP